MANRRSDSAISDPTHHPIPAATITMTAPMRSLATTLASSVFLTTTLLSCGAKRRLLQHPGDPEVGPRRWLTG